MGVPEHLDLFDTRRVQGKCPFYADTVSGDAPDSEPGVGAASLADAHDGAADQLDPLPLAFDDAKVHLHIVANPEVRKVRLETDIVLELLFF
jgi:hypothetical protein